jgi:hypothetical protein
VPHTLGTLWQAGLGVQLCPVPVLKIKVEVWGTQECCSPRQEAITF